MWVPDSFSQAVLLCSKVPGQKARDVWYSGTWSYLLTSIARVDGKVG